MKEEKSATEIFLPARDYDLAATLDSGQVFRWREQNGAWVGIVGQASRLPVLRASCAQSNARLETIPTGRQDACLTPRCLGSHVVRLKQVDGGIWAQTAAPVEDWDWLREFLQTDVDLGKILETFPDDEPMNRAVAACRGLRILRQEPWECLASFILSSTKQIVQIRQIVAALCRSFGERLVAQTSKSAVSRVSKPAALPHSEELPIWKPALRFSGDQFESVPDDLAFAFPSAERIASLTERDLRKCKMGFRAPNLLGAARHIADAKLNLERLRHLPYGEARAELMKLRGVGEKIADCVLLFACGFDSAFPVDVWVERALQTLYFPRRRASKKKLLKFAATHFGPRAGYAQQYLFHYMRMKQPRNMRRTRK